MARTLERFPEPSNAKYPWEEWLDGRVWELTPGEDFTAKVTTLRSNAQLQAKRRGGRVHVRHLDQGLDAERLVLQFRAR